MKYITDSQLIALIKSGNANDLKVARNGLDQLLSAANHFHLSDAIKFLEMITDDIPAQSSPQSFPQSFPQTLENQSPPNDSEFNEGIPPHLISLPTDCEYDPDSTRLYKKALTVCSEMNWDPRNRENFIEAVKIAERK